MANLLASNVSEEFTCPICLEIADDPVESSCCHHIFCQQCILPLNDNNCSVCRQKVNFTPSAIARRIIAKVPYECSYCEENITRETKRDHEALCQKNYSKCPAPNCYFKGKNEEFLFHLIEKHDIEILNNASYLFPKQQQNMNYHDQITCDNCGQGPILGTRYKCLVCPDFDLCESCEAKHLHDEHSMIRIVNPEDETWKTAFIAQQEVNSMNTFMNP